MDVETLLVVEEKMEGAAPVVNWCARTGLKNSGWKHLLQIVVQNAVQNVVRCVVWQGQQPRRWS